MYDTREPGFPNTFQTKFPEKHGTWEFIAAGTRNVQRLRQIFRRNPDRVSGMEGLRRSPR